MRVIGYSLFICMFHACSSGEPEKDYLAEQGLIEEHIDTISAELLAADSVPMSMLISPTLPVAQIDSLITLAEASGDSTLLASLLSERSTITDPVAVTPLADVMEQMFNAIDELHTVSFTLTNTERIDGELLTGIQEITLQNQPFKCYLYMIAPEEGGEVLFVEGTNKDKAIYKSNGFPFVSMDLDPMGSLMRDNNHHTLFESGFRYMADIVKEWYTRYPDRFRFTGEANWDNRAGYMVTVSTDDLGYYSYTVGVGETLNTIARKLLVSEYMILELNEDVDDYEDVTAGQVITVPYYYAKKMELFIDGSTYLPLLQKIYDDTGLYEQYSFRNVVVNPVISSEVFNKKNLGNRN